MIAGAQRRSVKAVAGPRRSQDGRRRRAGRERVRGNGLIVGAVGDRPFGAAPQPLQVGEDRVRPPLVRGGRLIGMDDAREVGKARPQFRVQPRGVAGRQGAEHLRERGGIAQAAGDGLEGFGGGHGGVGSFCCSRLRRYQLV